MGFFLESFSSSITGAFHSVRRQKGRAKEALRALRKLIFSLKKRGGGAKVDSYGRMKYAPWCLVFI